MNMKNQLTVFFAVFTIFLSEISLGDGVHQIFELGDFELESGEILPAAILSYVTHGQLNEDKDNLVLVPSAYLGDHHGFDFLIQTGKALSPEKYFIVATDMFQNGYSSSPSNTPPPLNGPNFPAIEIRDNVTAQHRLLTEKFGIKNGAAVMGFSMGAQQAFQWAVSHPDFMKQTVGICGSAIEQPHGIVRLEGFKSAIMADAAYMDGFYTNPPRIGLEAGGTHWAAWGTSQEWFRLGMYQDLGLESPDDFITFFQNLVKSWDANNLIALANTWQSNDVGKTGLFKGDSEAALSSIKSAVLYMPCETDQYFHIDALRWESERIPNSNFVVIPSLWGHMAGSGNSEDDATFINDKEATFIHSDK
jgi:homoserine O-acetyltransferase